MNDLVAGKASGRTRNCREHSRAFVDQFLAGTAIPNRTDVSEADLVSRKQQILFRKLWRLIESRLIPLAGGRIDRLIVERVAFDVLAGKRIPAASVLEVLLDEVAARNVQIQKIAHRGLRQLLGARPERAAAEFVGWLQGSCGAGLKGTPMGKHSADQERRRQLEEFVASPAAVYLAKEKTIPAVMGVKCLNMGSAGKIDVTWSVREGNVFQWFQSQPAVRELYVGYRLQYGVLDRTKPELLFVDQAFHLKMGAARKLASVPPVSPLAGRSHGQGSGGKAFRTAWQAAFDEYCREQGLAKIFRLRQGCFIEKEDGSRFQMRNFDKGKSWMKSDSFKGIRRVYRSPLASLD